MSFSSASTSPSPENPRGPHWAVTDVPLSSFRLAVKALVSSSFSFLRCLAAVARSRDPWKTGCAASSPPGQWRTKKKTRHLVLETGKYKKIPYKQSLSVVVFHVLSFVFICLCWESSIQQSVSCQSVRLGVMGLAKASARDASPTFTQEPSTEERPKSHGSPNRPEPPNRSNRHRRFHRGLWGGANAGFGTWVEFSKTYGVPRKVE